MRDLGVVMVDPEIQYSLLGFEQSRRDKRLERRGVHLHVLKPQPLPAVTS
jgi:hypothetical protein